MQREVSLAFEKFLDQKWRDSRNIMAANPLAWSGEGEKHGSGSKKSY